jgi:hypothetical protein
MPRAAIRRAIDLAHTAPPDLVVVTGDVITSERDPLEDCVVELSRLRVPLGLWGAATATTSGGSGWRHGRRRSLRATHAPAAAAVCGTVLARRRPQPDRGRRPTRTPARTVLQAARHRGAGPAGHPQPLALAQLRYLPPRLQRWASSSALASLGSVGLGLLLVGVHCAFSCRVGETSSSCSRLKRRRRCLCTANGSTKRRDAQIRRYS